MKHYLNKFANPAAYTTAKAGSSFYRPAVSLIDSSHDVMYDPMDPMFYFNPRYLYSDLSTSKNLNSAKTVIGVEVIPANHTTDGKARFVSVRNMSRAAGEVEVGSVATGNEDTNSAAMIPWGNWNDDIQGMTNYENMGYGLNHDDSAITEGNHYGLQESLSSSAAPGGFGFLPTDYDNGVEFNEYPFFGNTYLPSSPISGGNAVSLFPYPFNSDGSRNLLYNGTGQASMVISDMDGKGNTDILMARKTVTWTVGDALDTEVGDASGMSGKVNHPAAIACRRFNPASSNTSGQWYLPSAGELGYLFANIAKVNAKIAALPSGQGVKLGVLNSQTESVVSLGYWLWSSSERSDLSAWYLDLYYGYLGNNSKDTAGDNFRVRAFFSLQ